MNEVIVNILGAILIPLASAIGASLVYLITKKLIPWLNAKIGAEKLAEVTGIIRDVVLAAYAEMAKHTDWTGENAKAWAIAEAKTRFGIDLTDPKYDLIRKALVKELEAWKSKTE